VLSRTYRLSSANDEAAMRLDPENKLFWRMNRQRLDAEAIRDSMLAISGELTHDSGGPALVLENPENCGALSRKGVNPPSYSHKVPRPSQEFERTIYLPVLRGGPQARIVCAPSLISWIPLASLDSEIRRWCRRNHSSFLAATSSASAPPRWPTS